MKPAEKNLFNALKEETINLHMYWLVYDQLFNGTNKRTELLNATGSHIFYVLQILLIDELVLSICRLTDPAFSKIKGKQIANLSLKRLVAKVDGRTHKDLKRKLNVHVKDLDSAVKDFRAKRNKAIAHKDLATSMRLRTTVPGITKKQIKSVSSQIAATLNEFEHYHWNSTNVYDMVFLPLGSDGNYLVEVLKRGQWFRDLEKNNIKLRDLLSVSEYKNA
ncbi:MAG: hypothetical protein RPU34_12020 [Candidatus Sedimenticola sp. (ex Thyasira tokunagai)]